MRIGEDRQGTLDGLMAAIADLVEDPRVKGLMVLACEGNHYPLSELEARLRQIEKPLFGGLFPRIVKGQELWERGALVIGLSEAPRLKVIRNLSDPSVDLDEAVADAVDPLASEDTLVVFVDGLTRRISNLITALFENHGLQIGYIGGGAGSLTLEQQPCLLTQEGVLQDAAVLAQTCLRGGIGVGHGWELFSDPIRVTDSELNRIITLDYRPAIEVYREWVEPHYGKPIEPHGFFDAAKAYPFGIRRMDSEVVVRDPIAVQPDGSLICVGDVPAHAFVHILHGRAESLIGAARAADARAADARTAGAGSTNNPPGLRLLIDCISRVLFLEDRFTEELAAIDDDIPMLGALTLGEIANSGHDFLEFYNKTAVVGMFGKD